LISDTRKIKTRQVGGKDRRSSYAVGVGSEGWGRRGSFGGGGGLGTAGKGKEKGGSKWEGKGKE